MTRYNFSTAYGNDILYPSNSWSEEMKLLIATDMEGITGVMHWDQVTPGHEEYPRFRKLMTNDVNAAIRGAADAGVEEIIVTDGHWFGYNILIEELDPRAHLVSGTGGPLAMVEGAASKVDCAFFIGYHARAGSQNAILDHTWSSSRVHNVWLNDILVGETGVNAAVCGQFGVPVIMISGDQTVAAEASALLPEIETAVVKTASARMSAECLPPEDTEQVIYSTAYKAVQKFHSGKSASPFIPHPPLTMKVELANTELADRSALLPGATRLDGRTFSLKADSMVDLYHSFQGLVQLTR
jgi:D-amino peptidase